MKNALDIYNYIYNYIFNFKFRYLSLFRPEDSRGSATDDGNGVQ